VTINGPVAALSTNATPTNGVLTLCNDLGVIDYALDISNASPNPGAISSYEVTLTNDITGAVTDSYSGAAIPSPLSFNWTGTGYYTLTVEALGTNGCSAEQSYSVFAGFYTDPAVSLALPAGSLCEGSDLSIVVDLAALSSNPEGTEYTLQFANDPGFADIIFQWDGIHPAPASITVPDLPTSCGNLNNRIYVRWISANPCAQRIISSDIVVLHTPTAEFTAQDQLCLGQTLTGTPEFTETGGACNIPTEQWTLTNSSNAVVNQTGTNVHTYSFNQFPAPGNYTLTYSAQNFCGNASTSQPVCVESTTAPTVNWNLPNSNPIILCTPGVVQPVLTLPAMFCNTPVYTWQVLNSSMQAAPGTAFNLTGGNTLTPTITLITKGTYYLRVTVTAPCINGSGSWSATTPLITVAGAPVIAMQPITVCAGVQVCPFANVTVDNCFAPITNTVVTVDGATVTTGYCNTWNTPGTYEFCYSATNQCGTTQVCQDITITAGNSCSITPINDVCAGTPITLSTGQAGCTWEIDNAGTWVSIGTNPFPYTLNATTTFRASCNAGGCPCTTAPITVNVFSLPAFTTQINDPLCPGSAVSVTATTTSGTITSFNWTANGSPLPSGNSATVTLNSSTTLQVTGVYGTNCLTAPQNVVLNPVTNPLSALACPALLCENGNCVTLPAFAGATVELNNAPFADTQFCPADYAPGDYTLDYEVTVAGCDFSNSCTIEVIEQPTCSITPVPVQCPGTAFTPALLPAGLAGCNWQKSTNNGATWTPVTFPDFPLVTTLYQAQNCNVGGCGCGTLEIEVEVYESPALSLVADDPTPCPFTSTEVNVIQTGGDPVTNYTWSGNGVTGSGSSADVDVQSAPVTVGMVAQFGVGCSLSQINTTITPWVPPLVLNCQLTQLCIDFAPAPVATANVPVTWTLNGAAVPNATINPASLAPGNYTITALHTDATEGCTDADSCEFVVIDQIPGNIVLSDDAFCEGQSVSVTSFTNGGTLSVSNGTLTGTTISDLNNAPAVIQVTVDGPCIAAFTTTVDVNPNPVVETGPFTPVCFNECVDITPQTLTGATSSEWTWNGNVLSPATLCPDQLAGVVPNTNITLCLDAENEFGCTATDCGTIGVLPLPVFAAIDDPLCADETIALPACPSCTDYTLTLSNGTVLNYPGTYPVPSAGDYSWNITGTLGACSDELDGTLHVISLVTLNILEENIAYDPCDPVYPVTAIITGEDFVATWDNPAFNASAVDLGNNQWEYTIDHGTPIVLNTSYTDVLTVSNACNTVSESIDTEHIAPPSFSVDNDELFCSGSVVVFDIDVPFPINMDSFNVTSDWPGYAPTTFDGFPPDEILVPVTSGNAPDTLTFFFTGVNECGGVTVISDSIVVYPSDVVFDAVLWFEQPVCPGDTVSILVTELGGNITALSFNELLGDPLTLVSASDTLYQFTVNDVPLMTYPLEFSMDSEGCPPVIDLEYLELGPGFELDYSYTPVCPEEELEIINESNPIDGLYTWIFQPDTETADTLAGYNVSYIFETGGPQPIQLLATHPLLCPLDTMFAVNVLSNQFITGISVDPEDLTTVQTEGTLSATTTEAIESFVWINYTTGEFSLETNPVFTFDLGNIFSYQVCLIAESIQGCEATLCEEIVVTPELTVHVPSAFTPNGDRINDVFAPVVLGAKDEGYEFSIYDRWGQLVFFSTIPGEPWTGDFRDGEYFVQNDVYVWVIKAIPILGGDTFEADGTVTILR
jgi:gliding motility-associated-like protein